MKQARNQKQQLKKEYNIVKILEVKWYKKIRIINKQLTSFKHKQTT